MQQEGKRNRLVADRAFVEGRTGLLLLRDGTRVKLRPVLAEDKARLVAAFDRLSPESRYQRFMAPIDELTPDLLRYLTELDYVDHFAWLAALPGEPGEPAIGVARYVRLEDEPEAAEAAVTVVDDYQGRGLGTLLLNALGAVALENGIRRFRGFVLESNREMREVLRALGGRLTHEAPGVSGLEVDVVRRAEELRGTPLGDVLETLARGGGPVALG